MTSWTNSLTSQHVGEIDGLRVLVERYGDGSVTICTKPKGARTWGPPTELVARPLVVVTGGGAA